MPSIGKSLEYTKSESPHRMRSEMYPHLRVGSVNARAETVPDV